MLGSVNCISPLGVAKADTLVVNGPVKKGLITFAVFSARRVSPSGSRRTRSGASKPWWKGTAPKPSGPGSWTGTSSHWWALKTCDDCSGVQLLGALLVCLGVFWASSVPPLQKQPTRRRWGGHEADSSAKEMRVSLSQRPQLSSTPRRDVKGRPGDIAVILPVFSQISKCRRGSKAPQTMSRGGPQTHAQEEELSSLSAPTLCYPSWVCPKRRWLEEYRYFRWCLSNHRMFAQLPQSREEEQL